MTGYSSLFNINGDRDLSTNMMRVYYVCNKINVLLNLYIKNENLTIRRFECEDIQKKYERPSKLSPARILSNMFWDSLDWSRVKTELGSLRMLDIGCGTGLYYESMGRLSDIESYVGVDVKENQKWAELTRENKNVKFIKMEKTNLSDYIPANTNFIFSQSAMEHVENDMIYFRNIHDYIEHKKKDVIQVHLLPSPECLRLYRGHGFRQYNERMVNSIFSIFKKNSYGVLYKLGNDELNRLHYDYITKPVLLGRVGDLRESRNAEYSDKLFQLLKSKGRKDQSSFYALIIHSNFSNKLF